MNHKSFGRLFLWTSQLDVSLKDTVGLEICSPVFIHGARQHYWGWKCRSNKWKWNEAVRVQRRVLAFLILRKAAYCKCRSLWFCLCIPAFWICIYLWKFEPSWDSIDCMLNKEVTITYGSWFIGNGIKMINYFKSFVSFWSEILIHPVPFCYCLHFPVSCEAVFSLPSFQCWNDQLLHTSNILHSVKFWELLFPADFFS